MVWSWILYSHCHSIVGFFLVLLIPVLLHVKEMQCLNSCCWCFCSVYLNVLTYTRKMHSVSCVGFHCNEKGNHKSKWKFSPGEFLTKAWLLRILSSVVVVVVNVVVKCYNFWKMPSCSQLHYCINLKVTRIYGVTSTCSTFLIKLGFWQNDHVSVWRKKGKGPLCAHPC